MCLAVATAGNQMLAFFGISVDDFRVAGGLMLTCSPLRGELAPAEDAGLAFVVARAHWSAKANAADRARAIGMGVEAVLAPQGEHRVAAHQNWRCAAFPTPSHLR